MALTAGDDILGMTVRQLCEYIATSTTDSHDMLQRWRLAKKSTHFRLGGVALRRDCTTTSTMGRGLTVATSCRCMQLGCQANA